MWLIDTETYHLEHFTGAAIPEYAILSHRWGKKELSFSDLRECHMIRDGAFKSRQAEEEAFPMLRDFRKYKMQNLRSREGWIKVERCCEKAREYNLKWAWVDTVCIDKSSSAELQESINSMFKWYQNSSQCFIHMNDVVEDQVIQPGPGNVQFKESEWFKRGWTLQELIASPAEKRIFFNSAWNYIGRDLDLIKEVSSITRVPCAMLRVGGTARMQGMLLRYSVAQRFSWAARRKVTREEDIAYSLLGIFGINMTMLYGEGQESAFRRLQVEILKVSIDHSILAWNDLTPEKIKKDLATSPRDFDDASQFRIGHNVLLGSERVSRGITTYPGGVMVHSFLVDRQAANVPTELLQMPQKTTRFALPVCLSHPCPPEVDYDVVFLQLHHWRRSEYIRMNSLFIVGFTCDEWYKFRSRLKCREIFILPFPYI